MDIEHYICFLLLCNKLSQHTLSHHFNASGLWAQLSWVLCLGSHKAAKPRCQPSWFSRRALTGEESTSKLTQAIDRNHFLMVIGLEAPASCRWSPGGHPQLLEALLSSQQLPSTSSGCPTLPCGLPPNGHLLHQSSKESF